jgi:hypothetical protein
MHPVVILGMMAKSKSKSKVTITSGGTGVAPGWLRSTRALDGDFEAAFQYKLQLLGRLAAKM